MGNASWRMGATMALAHVLGGGIVACGDDDAASVDPGAGSGGAAGVDGGVGGDGTGAASRGGTGAAAGDGGPSGCLDQDNDSYDECNLGEAG